MTKLQRLFGADEFDIKSYKRFKELPKTKSTHLLYRGETRSPKMIKQAGGFFPQKGKANVSESGGSTAMVCLTLADHWLRQRGQDVLPRDETPR